MKDLLVACSSIFWVNKADVISSLKQAFVRTFRGERKWF